MTDPTPPPERPLPDESRARMRADLLAHAHDHRPGAPRWTVPAGAAAAVALVAGMGYWAVSGGDDNAVQPVPVLGGGTSSAPVTPSAADSSSAPSSVPSTETSFPAPTQSNATQVGSGDCRTELKYVLKGAEQAQGGQDVSFWVKGDQFALCYQMDGSTTVTHPLPVAPGDELATYRVASLYPPTADGYRTVRVAGGVVPQGAQAFDVQYTFPDGHTQGAQTAQDASGRTWWWMVYSYDGGGGNEMKKPPITLSVSYSGVQKSYTLAWGTDTCAQANHGC